jgi:hypothetical protein
MQLSSGDDKASYRVAETIENNPRNAKIVVEE